MTASNVELIDRDGNTLRIRGCRDKDEEIAAMASLMKAAGLADLRKPWNVFTKKIKSSPC